MIYISLGRGEIMPVIIAKWPNSTISVIQAPRDFSLVDLYLQLDEEGDPAAAEVYLLKTRGGWSHMTHDWSRDDVVQSADGRIELVDVTRDCSYIDTAEGKLLRIEWPTDIVATAIASLPQPPNEYWP
jgi:hypothetical protein